MEIWRLEKTMLQVAAAIEAIRATIRFKSRWGMKEREAPLGRYTEEALGLSVSRGYWAE